MTATIQEWMQVSHEVAISKGWWPEGEDRNVGEQLALFHSEVSEALEEWREGHPMDEIRHSFKSVGPYAPKMRSEHAGLMEVETRPGEWIPLTTGNAAQLGFDAKPLGFPIEMADLLIRVFDTCEKYGIDLQAALEAKTTYNRTRPYRHGGKKA